MSSTIDKQAVADRLLRISTTYRSVLQLSKAADINSQALYSTYLKGKSIPGATVLERLHGIGYSADYILFGVGLPPNPTVDEMDAEIERLEAELTYLRQLTEWRKAQPTRPDATAKGK